MLLNMTTDPSCSEKLNGKMHGLKFQRTTAFKAPPRNWIQIKLEKLHETLMQNTKKASV
jgi:hypothetical protein